MIPIKNLLNKIKWDKKENPSDYSVFYLDKVKNDLVELRYNNIKRIEGNFIVIGKEETYIPLHRIRKIRKKGKTVWKR